MKGVNGLVQILRNTKNNRFIIYIVNNALLWSGNNSRLIISSVLIMIINYESMKQRSQYELYIEVVLLKIE